MDFRILLDKITPALRNIARRHCLYGFYDAEDLYQEMCLYLLKNYRSGLPIGINEAYVIKGCEFHLLNFLRKGRPKAFLTSLDRTISDDKTTLKDILADDKESLASALERRLNIDEIKSLNLTKKENDVLSLLLKGHTVREAAKRLGVSHVMVLKHKKNIIKKWRSKGYQKG